METSPRIREWLTNVEKIMYRVMASSNFYNVSHLFHLEQAGFCTATMTSMPSPTKVVFYSCLTAGECYISEGPDGLIDTHYRLFYKTLKELADTFGENNLPKNAKKAYDSNKYEYVKVVQAVHPNKGRNINKRDNRNMPWSSTYFLYEGDGSGSSDDDGLLKRSGFMDNPIHTARWTAVGDHQYGMGPGIKYLPDIMMLQSIGRGEAIAIHKEVDPPLMVPSSCAGMLSSVPGYQNPVDNIGNNDAVKPLYQVRLNIRAAEVLTEKKAESIRQGFYNDLFIYMLNNPNMTATEVAERADEKLLLLGPTIERQEYEALDPVISRTFGICVRAGIIPPPPKEIATADLTIEYISLLAQAQRLVGARSVERTLGFVGNVAQLSQDISVWDNINKDKAVREYVEAAGSPESLMNDDKTKAAIRENRNKAAEADMRMKMAESQARIAKDMASADMSSQNALTELTGAGAGANVGGV
jgi:hypothetical protein